MTCYTGSTYLLSLLEMEFTSTEQTASRPAYKFIPKIVEQQFMAYQPGEPLDFFQWGWVRKPKGEKYNSPQLWSLVITLVGLVTTIGAAWAINEAVNTMYVSEAAVFLILIIPIFLLVIGPFVFFQSPAFCVIAFNDYLVFAKRKRVTILHWQEIATYERKTIVNHLWGNLTGNTHRYTVRTYTGQKLRWKVAEHVMEDLGNMINDRIGY